jgi:uncharacterized protein YndB with AHSA1/START domain
MTTASTKAARAVADLTEGVVLANVEIAATAERVFRALTDPKELVRWWGSGDTYRNEEWTADLRVGGRWRARGRGVDGKPFSVEGEFLEIDPPRKLVQSWKPDWDGGHLTTVTYRLEPIAGGTRVTVRHAGFGERRESCQNHGQGWEKVLGWLQEHLTVRQHFLCRLIPPRPTFQQDMSDAERKVMQEHVAYWTGLCEKGVALVFGPVADPKGGYGVGIIRVGDQDELAELQRKDPTIRAGLGFNYETLPMPTVVRSK